MNDDSLLGQQVIGWKVVDGKWILDENVISILRMMYPDFRLVKGIFDIYPGDSFIYIGSPDYINSVKNKPNPHIIVARTGIDLLNRQTLVDYVFAFKGKQTPKYLEELINEKNWDDDTFYYNLKFVLLLGSVPEKELNKNSMFLSIVDNFSNPFNLIVEFFRMLELSDDSLRFLESSLVSFINNAKHMSDLNTKSDIVYISRAKFMQSYGKSVSSAVYNLLDSNVELNELRVLNFILDLTMGGRK